MAEIKRYKTPVFRLSFPHLFEPDSFEGGPPKYGISAVWDPSKFSDGEKKLWKQLLAALDEASMARFKKKWSDLPANFKKGLRDGAEKADLEGYGDGTVFANVSTKMRPGLVDQGRRPIVTTADHSLIERFEREGKEYVVDDGDVIYPGCYCRATVTVYSYDNKGKGVALGLMNIQKVKDGDRLDSRTDASADFDDDIEDQWLEEGEDDPLD